MKINLQDCLVFQEVYNGLKDKIIPIQLAYSLTLLNEKNKTNYNFWQEEFNKILNLYCEKNEDGAIKMSDDQSSFIIVKDKIEECQKAIMELNNTEVEIEKIKIKNKDFEKLNETNLKFGDLEILLKFLEVSNE